MDHLHEGSQAPDAVDELSASSAEDVDFAPVPGGRKRKIRKCRVKRPDKTDALNVRRVLAIPCHNKCRRGCKQHFQGRAEFEELLKFRREFEAYHKLDQDQIVPSNA